MAKPEQDVAPAASAVLVVSGEFNIYTVAALKEQLWQQLAASDEVEVDLAAVEEFDTAGLQLMLISKRWPGKQVHYCNHSPAVLRLIELSNVMLGDPLILSGSDGSRQGGR